MVVKRNLVRKIKDKPRFKKSHQINELNGEIAFMLFSHGRSLGSFPYSGGIKDALEQFLKSSQYRKRFSSGLEDQEKLYNMLKRITRESNAHFAGDTQLVELSDNYSEKILGPSKSMAHMKSAINHRCYSKKEIKSPSDENELLPTSTMFLDWLMMDDYLSNQFSTNKSSQGSSWALDDDQQSCELHLLEGIALELNHEKASKRTSNSMDEPPVWSMDPQMSSEMDDLAIFSKLVEHTTFTKYINFKEQ